MIQREAIDSLSPLQCQLIVLAVLLDRYLSWPVLREVLRASCGSARPDDAALDAAYRELDAKGAIRPIHGVGYDLVTIYVSAPHSNIRRRAASAFGPIDYQMAKAMMRKLNPERQLPGETDDDGKSEARDAARELAYLADIRAGDRFADRLDAIAGAMGFWPSEYDYGNRGNELVRMVREWPAPRPKPIAELMLPWNLMDAFKNGQPANAILDAIAAINAEGRPIWKPM
ncbi:MAG: hypothetical protein IJK04_00730, partial [Kiritimatiellae bacterium]|nr:hypothetical protein [Kiritimatiellia bacterium]